MSAITSGSPALDPLFFTPGEVAELLQVSKRELKEWRESGRGPKFVLVTRRTIYYWRVEVLAFLPAPRGE